MVMTRIRFFRNHWRMVFEDNDGGVDDEKALLHAKR